MAYDGWESGSIPVTINKRRGMRRMERKVLMDKPGGFGMYMGSQYKQGYYDPNTGRDMSYAEWNKGAYGEAAQASRPPSQREQMMTKAQALMERYTKDYNEAKQANVGRYNEILGLFDKDTGQRASDIRTDYMNEGANLQQRYNRIGMGNTSGVDTLRQGNLRNMQDSLNRNSDRLIDRRAGFMERRNDPYPDKEMYTGLLGMYGQAAGAASRGGGGGYTSPQRRSTRSAPMQQSYSSSLQQRSRNKVGFGILDHGGRLADYDGRQNPTSRGAANQARNQARIDKRNRAYWAENRADAKRRGKRTVINSTNPYQSRLVYGR